MLTSGHASSDRTPHRKRSTGQKKTERGYLPIKGRELEEQSNVQKVKTFLQKHETSTDKLAKMRI